MEDSQSRVARERVMADLRALAADAEFLLRATVGDVGEKAREARIRVAAALGKAKATYARLQAQSLASAKAAMRSTDATIRAHPYESIGIAFGMGLLLGVLLRRK